MNDNPPYPFTMQGRIGRLRFAAWTAVLVMVVYGTLGLLFELVPEHLQTRAGFTLGLLILAICFMACAVCIFSQRLHDTGHSA